MKRILLAVLLLCSIFAFTGAVSPENRRGVIRKDDCEKIWKECYGKVSVTQNRSEARYWFYVENDKNRAQLLISLSDKYEANRPGRWFMSTDPYGIKIAFVQSRLDADCVIAFVPEGKERFNWR